MTPRSRPELGIGIAPTESVPSFPEPRRAPTAAPNIVLVVLDDLGFADLGCFGSDIETPSIGSLARSGLRYNNFHATAICTSSRASFLTGRNHHAVGMGLGAISLGFPGYTARIPRSAASLPRILRDAGYSTFAAGKWHLAPHVEMTAAGPFDNWPIGLGFERFYGFLGGMTSQWAPELVRDNGYIDTPGSSDYHLTEDLAEQAMRFVQDQQQADPDKPFFLYFATGAPHWPHHVSADWSERYRGRFDSGWEAWREDTFRRQVREGVVPPSANLSPRPSWVPQWDALGCDEKRLYSRMMEIYAGFLSHTDAQIGRLVDFLDALQILDDTLFLIVSDNGASADGGPHGVIRMAGNDVSSMLDHIDDMGGPRLGYNHYAWGWAWAGNTPFKLWKHYTWLGGVRVPLILRWPRGIPSANNGAIRAQFCHAIDIMPTVLDIADVPIPDAVDGVAQDPVAGASMRSTLSDANAPSPRTTQYFEMQGSRAIYFDGWKATTDHVMRSGADRKLIPGSHSIETDKWSLYNLSDDFAEVHDVADEEGPRLERLIELWRHEAERNQVLPIIDAFRVDTPDAAGDWKPSIEPQADRIRRRYRCLPGGRAVHTPSPFDAGFDVLAVLEFGHESQGVICCQWSMADTAVIPGGWVCCLKDDQIIVAFEFAGHHQRMAASLQHAVGRRLIGVKFRPDHERSLGLLTVQVDGVPVGDAAIDLDFPEMTARRVMAARLRVGQSGRYPIGNDYEGPFPFTGQIKSLVFEVPESAASGGSAFESPSLVLKHD